MYEHTERNYYLFCISRDYSEDTITYLCLSDEEFETVSDWIINLNNNTFKIDYFDIPCTISYCKISFPTVANAKEYYEKNRHNIYWISDSSDYI